MRVLCGGGGGGGGGDDPVIKKQCSSSCSSSHSFPFFNKRDDFSSLFSTACHHSLLYAALSLSLSNCRARRSLVSLKKFSILISFSACTARAFNLSEINYNRASKRKRRAGKKAVRISLNASASSKLPFNRPI